MLSGDSSVVPEAAADPAVAVVVVDDIDVEVDPRFRFRSIFLASMPSVPFDDDGFSGELGVGVVDVFIGVDGMDLARSSGIKAS